MLPHSLGSSLSNTLVQTACIDCTRTKHLRLVLAKPSPWKSKHSKHHQLSIVSFSTCCPEVESFDPWCRNGPHSATRGPTDAVLLRSFPKGAKIVHRQFHGGSFRVDENIEVKVHGSCTSDSDSHEVITVGIPREAMDFLSRAVKAGHPRTVGVHSWPSKDSSCTSA